MLWLIQITTNNFFGPEFASVPAKIDKMSKTVNAIKASIDMLEAKSLTQVSKACDVQPKDDHIDSLVVCKSLDDILMDAGKVSSLARSWE